MTIKDIPAILREHPFFQGFEEQALGELEGCAQNAVFAPGSYLLREGAVMDRFYLLRHGHVALESAVPGSGEAIVATLGPGEIVGVSWLVPPYRARLDARALEGVRALAFDAACLRGKCDADPALGYAFLKRFSPKLIERLTSARLQALDAYTHPAEKRAR